VAAVLGALFAPLVEQLARRGVPRSAGGVLVIVLLLGIVVSSAWMVVVGIAEQGRQISSALGDGLDEVQAWMDTRGLGNAEASLRDQAAEVAAAALGGASAYLPGLLSGTVSFALGIAIGTFLVYYVLVDWPALTLWVGGHLGLDESVGAAVVEDTIGAVRRYFSSLTLSAVVVAVLIGLAAVLLDVPLAFTIAVVTLVTSYIPYLGAIFSGAFATLVALGATDLRTALVMLVVVLIVQNIVQTVILTRLTSTALKLHPIVTLGSTIVGTAVAGALGAMLAAPAAAVWILVDRRLQGTRSAAPVAPVAPVAPAPDPV
jgi:putative heme transporter